MARRAFLSAFFYSFIAMGCGLLILWGTIRLGDVQTGTPQPKVPVLNPGTEDSKTILARIDFDGCGVYYILKFNAIENKIGILALSPRFMDIDTVWNTEGPMRAKERLKQSLGIPLDFYLDCGESQARAILQDFSGIELADFNGGIPQVIKSLLLKNAQRADVDSLFNAVSRSAGFLDNGVGLEFLSRCAHLLTEANFAQRGAYCFDRISQVYRHIDTDMNKNSLDRLKIISRFLSRGTPEIHSDAIIFEDGSAGEKITRVLGL